MIAGPAGSVRVPISTRPVELQDLGAPVVRVHAVALEDPDFQPNQAFLAALKPALQGVGLALVLQAEVASDRWMQDAYELGVLGGAGPAMQVWIKLDRSAPDQGLFDWAERHLLAPGVGVVYVGASGASPLNGGGNIDVLPGGRPLIGADRGGPLLGSKKQSRSMAPAEAGWLAAQGEAPLALDVGWLKTGHLDEIVQPILVRGSTVVVAAADPRLGLALLARLDAATKLGGKPVQRWRSDPEFSKIQEEAALRVEGALAALKTALAPRGLRVVPLPVLFELLEAPEGRLARSILPNAANLFVVGERAFYGAQGVSLFDREVTAQLAAAGLQAVALDVSAYHPNGGDAHCAVLLERRPTPRTGR